MQRIAQAYTLAVFIGLIFSSPLKAEICRMGKSAFSEKAIVCECPQLLERSNGNYDLVSRRLICDIDGTNWKVADDGGPQTCFNITNLGRNPQLNNLSRLSQSMAGCSP